MYGLFGEFATCHPEPPVTFQVQFTTIVPVVGLDG
jgi:hypothetical protein